MRTKFKVGDRVLTHSTPLPNPQFRKDFKRGGPGFKPNKEGVITHINYDSDCNVMFLENDCLGIYEGNFSLVNESKLKKIWF